MENLRIAVVGVGHLGQHHARILAGIKGVELVGVVDTDGARAGEIGALHGVPALDLETALDRSEAVSLVVPTRLHGDLGLKALDRGCHLFVEKPIAATLEEADALIALAREKGLALQVGHIERFNAGVLAMWNNLTKPRFIESHRLGPPSPRIQDVGVVLDLMIHDLDLVLSLVGSPAVRMEALGVPVLTEREDIANARIRFESGCIADLTVSRVTPERQRKVRIFQPDAYLSLDLLNQSLEIFRRKRDESTGALFIDREMIKPERHDALTLELESFVRAVKEKSRPVVTGEEGREALRLAIQIIEQIGESLQA